MPFKDRADKQRYQREWCKTRRTKWIEEHGGCCVKCGSIIELEVDNLDRNLKVSHRIWSWRKERREAELAKCQILCKSCHEKKTTAENIAEPEGKPKDFGEQIAA